MKWGAPGSPIPRRRVLPSPQSGGDEQRVFGAGEWALAGSENNPVQTPALSFQTHLSQDFFLFSISFVSWSCGSLL